MATNHYHSLQHFITTASGVAHTITFTTALSNDGIGMCGINAHCASSISRLNGIALQSVGVMAGAVLVGGVAGGVLLLWLFGWLFLERNGGSLVVCCGLARCFLHPVLPTHHLRYDGDERSAGSVFAV